MTNLLLGWKWLDGPALAAPDSSTPAAAERFPGPAIRSRSVTHRTGGPGVGSVVVTPELAVFAAVRIAGSLPVLRWPLAGGLLAVAVDFADLFVRDLLGAAAIGDYQAVDKWLDQVYLAAFLVVALRWRGRERTVAGALYAYRLVGFAFFEATGDRIVLVLFPNVFELWFLLVGALHRRAAPIRWTTGRTVAAIAGCLVVKLGHEVALHGLRLFDGYSTLDALDAIWRVVSGTTG